MIIYQINQIKISVYLKRKLKPFNKNVGANEIAEKHFLNLKRSKRLSRFLSDCPSIEKSLSQNQVWMQMHGTTQVCLHLMETNP